MLKVLLFLARGLKGIGNDLKRIADALDRAHPLPRKGASTSTFVAYDEDSFLDESDRRAKFEARRGRPLADDEEIPGAFDHTDRLGAVRRWLGVDEPR